MIRSIESSHIKEEVLICFIRNELDQGTAMTVLEHLAQCEYCSGRYGERMETNLTAAPRDLKEQVMKRVSRENGSLQPAKYKYYTYCARVAFGCAAAIFLTFSMNFGNMPTNNDTALMYKTNGSIAETIQKGFETLTDYFTNKEVK